VQDESNEPFTFDLGQAAALLEIMSSPARIGVLQRVTTKEWDVAALAADLEMGQSALSQHLAKLRDAKMVNTRRAAQQIFYSSDSPAVLAMLQTLESLGPMPVGRRTEAQEAARQKRIGQRRSYLNIA
jgi:ArsR family transcriptional regulator, virulence genes transcriptional regulator